jgi:hypothetical protein
VNFDGLPELKNNRHLEWASDQLYLTFGKNAGETLEDVALSEPEYVKFLLTLALPDYVREYLEAALEQTDSGG